MPVEPERLEARGGLLDQRLVLADDPERSQGERLQVRALANERSGLLDGRPIAKRRQRVQLRGERRRAQSSTEMRMLADDLRDRVELAAHEREPEKRLGLPGAEVLHRPGLGGVLQLARSRFVAEVDA